MGRLDILIAIFVFIIGFILIFNSFSDAIPSLSADIGSFILRIIVK